MSADDYYIISPHNGEYAALHGFMGDGSPPLFLDCASLFNTWQEARQWAQEQGPEYGVTVDPQCIGYDWSQDSLWKRVRSLEDRVAKLERRP